MFFIPLINISILFFQKDILKIYSQPDAPTNGSILKANTVNRHIESSFINSGHLIEDQDDSHWHTVTSFSILYIVFLLPTFSLPVIQFSYPALSLLSENKGS